MLRKLTTWVAASATISRPSSQLLVTNHPARIIFPPPVTLQSSAVAVPHAGLKATNRGRLVRSARRGRYEIGIMGEMNRNSATDSEREAGELPDPALEIEASGDANQAMYLPFTSGTTGEPEGGYAQRQHAARHGTDDGARLPVGARGALNAEPVQPQSGSRCADHRARRRRRTGRPRSAARREPARSAGGDPHRVSVRSAEGAVGGASQ